MESTPPPPQPPGLEPTPDERNLAVFAHLGGIVSSFGVPLVLWLSRRHESRFVEDQAREALNCQLTFIPIYFVCSGLFAFCIGISFFMLAFIVNGVLAVTAAMGAKEGRLHRYPFALRLLS